MIRRSTFVFAALAGAVGVASFAITWTARAQHAGSSAESSQEALLKWLEVDPSQHQALSAQDPSFGDDLAKLRNDLAKSRSALADALDDSALSDEELRERSEAVIAAGATLERRVTEHLIALRPHLTQAQQRRLFGLCADGVRGGRGGQWRHGRAGGR